MSFLNVFVRVMGVTAIHFSQAETVYFSMTTSQFVNISACSQTPRLSTSLLPVEELLWGSLWTRHCGPAFPVLLGKYEVVELLGHRTDICLTLRKIKSPAIWLFKVVAQSRTRLKQLSSISSSSTLLSCPPLFFKLMWRYVFPAAFCISFVSPHFSRNMSISCKILNLLA